MNLPLIAGIKESNLNFEDISIFAGIPTHLFIKAIQDEFELDAVSKSKVSAILGKPVEELFPRNGAKD